MIILLDPKTKEDLNQYDYIFSKEKDFKRLEPYLIKKFDSNWKILLLDFKIKSYREIISKYLDISFVSIDIKVKQDVYISIRQQYPMLKQLRLSKYDEYLNYVSTLDIIFEGNVGSVLYEITKGNLDSIKDVIRQATSIGLTTLTKKDLSKFTIEKEAIYARDVLLSLLLLGNDSIPRKGHILSKYKYKKWYDLYEELVLELGDSYAFNSLRKASEKLYKQKLLYLDGEEIHDRSVVSIDVYTLLNAYTLFLVSNYKQCLAILVDLERRQLNHVNCNRGSLIVSNA